MEDIKAIDVMNHIIEAKRQDVPWQYEEYKLKQEGGIE